jgi:hypothetical protein
MSVQVGVHLRGAKVETVTFPSSVDPFATVDVDFAEGELVLYVKTSAEGIALMNALADAVAFLATVNK